MKEREKEKGLKAKEIVEEKARQWRWKVKKSRRKGRMKEGVKEKEKKVGRQKRKQEQRQERKEKRKERRQPDENEAGRSMMMWRETQNRNLER